MRGESRLLSSLYSHTSSVEVEIWRDIRGEVGTVGDEVDGFERGQTD